MQRITTETPSAVVKFVELDLADLSSISTAAESITGRLDLLINNAGLMATDKSKTKDGFETQFGVNHLGHFALTSDLLPLLIATPGSRVVNMSSMGHRMGKMQFDDVMFEKRYDRWRPYFQSKLANLLFTAELRKRLEHAGHQLLALSAHPGASRTDLGTEGGGVTNKAMREIVPFVTQSADRGAEPALRAATDPRAKSGEFYGPRWIGRGPAAIETPSKRARKASDAARLWEISEVLTNRHTL